MGLVFINGRAAVYKDGPGQAVAFPDVCLCPPGPPAGPVPVPLSNTVVAADLQGCAKTVLIAGKPAAHLKSFFAKSTGNEVSRSTGGGVISHATQGMAYFQTGSPNVFIEGQPAVRHADLLTCNHLSTMPPNTPPTVWMSSTTDLPMTAPGKVRKTLAEGKDWIELVLVDEDSEPLGKGRYEIKTPGGEQVSGNILRAGKVELRQVASGACEVVLPLADERARQLRLNRPAKVTGDQKAYVPGKPLRLPTGKQHVVVVPYTKSLWVDLPVRVDDPDTRDDEFVLHSEDGSYRVTLTIADDRIAGDEGLTLEYYGLEPGKSYTLTHHLGDGLPSRILFTDLSYEELFPKAGGKAARHREVRSEIESHVSGTGPEDDNEPHALDEEDDEIQLHDEPPAPGGNG
jgi:uncharacterized Zn-binding protein involved in type VI secretion